MTLPGGHAAVVRFPPVDRREDPFVYDGNWSGNDTLWRTILDLNRILLHADKNGELRTVPVSVEFREAGHAPALEAIAGDAAPRTRVHPRVDHLGILLGLGMFAYLLAYPRVLNISDESVVLYAANRILEGQVIYRDFFEFLTPVSFYFFALVYAVAG